MDYTYEMFEYGMDFLELEISSSGREFDYIIGLNRGGLIPAVVLSHRLDIPMIALNFQTRDSKFRSIDSNTKQLLLNKAVLVVEDIVDSGKTIELLKKELEGLVVSLDVAALVYNVEQDVDARYYDVILKRSEDQAWVNFWWEEK